LTDLHNHCRICRLENWEREDEKEGRSGGIGKGRGEEKKRTTTEGVVVRRGGRREKWTTPTTMQRWRRRSRRERGRRVLLVEEQLTQAELLHAAGAS